MKISPRNLKIQYKLFKRSEPTIQAILHVLNLHITDALLVSRHLKIIY